jgi:hypothetical protein
LPSVPKFRGDLSSVAADSSTDAWAVGGALTLHWNGKAWSKVAEPVATASLSSVKVFSRSNAWAVGGYCVAACSTNGGTYAALVLHWNGRKWSRVAAPSPGADGQTYIYGVSAGSGTSVWAVGEYLDAANADRTLTLHWNGKNWS